MVRAHNERVREAGRSGTTSEPRSITSADVKAWLEARIAELSIVGRSLTSKERETLEVFTFTTQILGGEP